MTNTNVKVNTVLASIKNESKEAKRKAIIREVIIDIIWFGCLIIAGVIFNHYCGISQIVGESMEPSFEDGDVVIVVRDFTPDYGDVVVADTSNKLIIKRVIGMEGDEIDFYDGKVYRNGVILDEDYTKGRTFAYDELVTFPVTVGEGQVFLLGDNRENSADSRSSMYGLVDEDELIGKATIHIPVVWKIVIIGAVAIFVACLILSILKDKEEEKKAEELAAKLMNDGAKAEIADSETAMDTKSAENSSVAADTVFHSAEAVEEDDDEPDND